MLTKREMAKRLGVHEHTLLRWAEYGIVVAHAYNGHAYLYEDPGPRPVIRDYSFGLPRAKPASPFDVTSQRVGVVCISKPAFFWHGYSSRGGPPQGISAGAARIDHQLSRFND